MSKPSFKRLPQIEAALKTAGGELAATTLAYRVGYTGPNVIMDLVRAGVLEVVSRKPRFGHDNTINKDGVAVVRLAIVKP